MKNKILICLSFIFLVCLFCLPLAFNTQEAYAITDFDLSSYTVKSAATETQAPLYSNGRGEYIINSETNPSSPKVKKLTTGDITGGASGKEFRTLNDFEGRVYMLPVAKETENVTIQFINELGVPKLQISAVKAGTVIIYVAIGDIGAPADQPEIYIINLRVICDLPQTLKGNIHFWDGPKEYYPLSVGEQKQISIDEIIKRLKLPENGGPSDFIDSTNIYFYAVSAESASASDGVKIKTFYMGKLFTIFGEKEHPVPGTPYLINIILRETSPEAQSLEFQMQVLVTAAPQNPIINIDKTNIGIKADRRITAEFLATSPDGNPLFFNANTNGTRHSLRDNNHESEFDPVDGVESWVVKTDVCEARIITDMDKLKNQLEIKPIKNGFVRLVVYVANYGNEALETKILLSITVSEIYEIKDISIDSLRKVTFSIHDDIFGELEKDGYSLTGIESNSENKRLGATVESGSLMLNPKGEGEVVLTLIFSDGASRISLPVTVVVHKFDLLKDLSNLEITIIAAGLLLLVLLTVVIIVRGVRKRKKKVVEKIESTVVIGRRDSMGQVVNPVLQKAVQPQKAQAFVSSGNVSYNTTPPYQIPFQPAQAMPMQLNAGYPVQQPFQSQPFQSQPFQAQPFQSQPFQPIQPQPQPVYMALTAPREAQPEPQPINVYVAETPADEQPQVNNVYSLEEKQPQAQPVIIQPQVLSTPIVVAQEPPKAVAEEKPAAAEPVTAKPDEVIVIMPEEKTLTDDEILEKVYKEKYQETMKYRQFRKDKELQTKILAEEHEKIRLAKEAREGVQASKNGQPTPAKASAAGETATADKLHESNETTVQGTTEALKSELVSDKWLEEASLSELIDKKMDMDEEILKTNSILKDIAAEKEKMETAANEAMKKYKDLEKEIEELKIKLNNTPNPDDASPIYEKLNAAEGSYDEMKENMPAFAAKLKEKQAELSHNEEELKKHKASLDLSKMDIDDRIKELKDKLAADGVVTISMDTIEALKAEAVAESKRSGTEQVSDEELENIIQGILAASAAKGESDLKREDIKLKKEFAEEELKEYIDKLTKTSNDAEKQVLRTDIENKKADLADIEKMLADCDKHIAEQAVELAAQEAKLNNVYTKSDEQIEKLTELANARAKQEATLKEQKERIIADRQTTEDKKQKAEEMDALTEFILKTVTDRNRTELKADNVKFRKELAEQKLKELEERYSKSTSASEQAALKSEIAEKKEDTAEYNKKLREYESYIAEYDEKMKELEENLKAITDKYGMEKQMQEFNMARVQQDFDHKVDKERIRSERAIEIERIEAERKIERERQEGEARLSNLVDERAAAAEKALEAVRAENEKRLRELEEKAKLGSLEERLAYKRQQLNFVAEDVPRMRDAEQGHAMLQKVEKIEKDLAQDERKSDIIFEIGRVKDSIHHTIQLQSLRSEMTKRDSTPAAAPAVAPAAPTRTVVRKVTNNVRKVSRNDRQPQVIRVSGSRPNSQQGARGGQRTQRGTRGTMDRTGQRQMARPGTRSAERVRRGGPRPVGRTARPGERSAARTQAKSARTAARR